MFIRDFAARPKKGETALLKLWTAWALFMVLTGCAVTGEYRVESHRWAGTTTSLIVQPNTTLSYSANDKDQRVSINVLDILDRVSTPQVCGHARLGSEAFGAQPIHVVRDGQVVRGLRFSGTPDNFLNAATIRTAVQEWWSLSKNRIAQCLPSGAQEWIIRSLSGQRPLTADAAIEWWYGPSVGSGTRAVILRPGMRVCVTDIQADGQNAGRGDGLSYALSGGPVCARLGDSSLGLHFDPVAARFTLPLSDPTWGAGTGGSRRISSWPEMQRPYGAQTAYVLVYPRNMVTSPQAQPDPARLPLILAVDRKASVEVSSEYGGPITYPALEGVLVASRTDTSITDLCSKDGSAVTCVRFGDRGVFTADFPVNVNDRSFDVPVGATLGMIAGATAPDFVSKDLYGVGDASLLQDVAASARQERTLGKLRLRRWFEGRRVDVQLDSRHAADFPLQPGDEIKW